MKILFRSLLLLLITSPFFNCEKNKDVMNAHFYTRVPTTDAKLSLFVDGDLKGALPFVTKQPGCSEDSLSFKTLSFTMREGKYKIEAKDEGGNVKSSGTIKFSKNRSSTSGGIGGTEMLVQGDCLMVGLF